MKVTSHEYEGQPGMVVVELRDDIEAEYGSQLAPGIHIHYAETEDGGRLPVFIEIEVWKERVLFEHRRDGRVSAPENVNTDELLSTLKSVEAFVKELATADPGESRPKTKKD